MSNTVIPRKSFLTAAKRLAKKYRSFPKDLSDLIDDLRKDATIGVPLGGGVYKIRLAIKSKGAGKSGGARVITYVLILKETVYLLSVYDKSEQADISDADLKRLVMSIEEDMK